MCAAFLEASQSEVNIVFIKGTHEKNFFARCLMMVDPFLLTIWSNKNGLLSKLQVALNLVIGWIRSGNMRIIFVQYTKWAGCQMSLLIIWEEVAFPLLSKVRQESVVHHIDLYPQLYWCNTQIDKDDFDSSQLHACLQLWNQPVLIDWPPTLWKKNMPFKRSTSLAMAL